MLLLVVVTIRFLPAGKWVKSVTDVHFLKKKGKKVFFTFCMLDFFGTSLHQHNHIIWSVFFKSPYYSPVTYFLAHIQSVVLFIHSLSFLFTAYFHCTFCVSSLSVINQYVFEKDKPIPQVCCITNGLLHSALKDAKSYRRASF